MLGEVLGIIMIAILIMAHFSMSPKRSYSRCSVPACGGRMVVVLPSEIVESGVRDGVPRDQVKHEVVMFYASTGVKVISRCTVCGKMAGHKF